MARPWVRRYERGLCTSEEFAAGLVADWGLAVEAAAFLELFRAWPAGLFPGAEDLVLAVRQRRRVGCLSNTNVLHWDLMGSGWGLAGLFDAQFLSHQLGLVKPDRELFDHVVEMLEVQPEQVLFLDDNTLNVDEAKAAGWAAVRVSGTHEARRALAAHGVL